MSTITSQKSANQPVYTKRKFLKPIRKTIKLPNLIENQINSYEWFLKKGLRELLNEVSPIASYSKYLELSFKKYYLDEPKYDEKIARDKNISYEASLKSQIELVNKKTGKSQIQECYLGDIPLMTDRGTFIINGVERVVVSQLIKSPGVFFNITYQKEGQKFFGAKMIPTRGAWLEIETEANGGIFVKIDRKRKVAVTSLLRAFGYPKNEDLLKAFSNIDKGNIKFIEMTIKHDSAASQGEGYKEVYKRIRPGDLATADNAKSLIDSMFFNFERYDFGTVGRFKINERLGGDTSESFCEKAANRIFNPEDLVMTVKEIIRLNNSLQAEEDDIDHLKNRRVRAVGELVQEKFRLGLLRMQRNIRDRMSTSDFYTVAPAQLVNSRPLIAVIREFFMSSQLCQFMDQVNPLAELEHKRRLSTMGPGGLVRERAGFKVRDVHSSHYGRICPIQTPEGANIGLVGHLATYAKVNKYGFLETPYRKVENGRLTDEVVFINAGEEEKYNIAHPGIKINEKREIIDKKVEARIKGKIGEIETSEIQFIDIDAKQPISVATSLIPFLEHDDAQRALMGSNMQRQAVSCIKPESPVVGTGMEIKAATDSGQIVLAKESGEIKKVDSEEIIIKSKKDKSFKETVYKLQNFACSNAATCMTQHPRVVKNQKIKAGDLLADGAATEYGELALGQNLLVAFMPWKGGNFEDAVIISDELLHGDRFSSIHIEDFSVDIRDTKLGPELVTRDIPNVGEEKLRNLDEEGIIRIGAEVTSGDILIGKITPKGETELTAEERLLRSIFGEKAREVKDTSLYLQHGEHGKIIGIKIFSRKNGDKLPPGVIQQIQVRIAQIRKVSVGDKLAGRHGNKGVISRIMPKEDMPYLADGTPVQIILNPLGVASRMNIGQILETHLGWAAKTLGYKVACPSLDGIPEEKVKEELTKANLPQNGKIQLYDGRTGEPFVQQTTVGIIYVMKLNHLVEDKIHMRSIGPYSLITQQPLGGKAQFGGQRFGEMEVWALEGYGAAYTLQEILTIKSDDVLGRSKAYESIIKGEKIKNPHIPASFHVLVNELKALGLSVELIEKEKKEKEK
jgi:DNA-directed RNA polymerase subunit beta